MKLVAFSGSVRESSCNQKLLEHLVAVNNSSAEVELISLRDYPMPLYDGDEEEENGKPQAAQALTDLLASKDGMIIASPEYNGLPSPRLKNTLDWISRPSEHDKDPMRAFRGKNALLLAASPGGLGGLRGLPHLRQLLSNIGVIVWPEQLALSGAYTAFDDDGALKDRKKTAQLQAMLANMVAHAS